MRAAKAEVHTTFDIPRAAHDRALPVLAQPEARSGRGVVHVAPPRVVFTRRVPPPPDRYVALSAPPDLYVALSAPPDRYVARPAGHAATWHARPRVVVMRIVPIYLHA